mmetsp:Transcript_13540/g.22255  ORF Transcript_13540/g.22255 Transcript_13540/m.22255 type:complete len:103 (-) Transcript_13540:1301-1609(-)
MQCSPWGRRDQQHPDQGMMLPPNLQRNMEGLAKKQTPVPETHSESLSTGGEHVGTACVIISHTKRECVAQFPCLNGREQGNNPLRSEPWHEAPSHTDGKLPG